jgi:two-component system, cell cycle response regulator
LLYCSSFVSPKEDRASTPPASGSLGTSVEGSTIVLAEDDRLTREHTSGVLRSRGFVVETFEDGQLVIERVARGGVDLVLLDVLMPKMSGLEACRVLKGMQRDSFLPVVLLTVKADTASRVEGLKIGADDYVCKPFEEQELLARIDAMLRIKKLHDHVNHVRSRLEQLSLHDDLTGLFNYRYLHSRLNEEFKRAERYHEPLSCMVIDIDSLQQHNESMGREHGDGVIKHIADSLRRTVREIDVVARFGGDEFLVALPSTHFAGSVTVAERLWREVSRPSPSAVGERKKRPTISIGVALYPSRDVRTKDALLRGADTALRQAKRDGGNRICVFQQEGYLYTPVSEHLASLSSAPPGARSLAGKGGA